MDQISLVGKRISDGERLLRQLVRNAVDVSAAFWLRPLDDPWWKFYIASRVVDAQGPKSAYQALQDSLFEGICISLTEITLIGATNPATLEVRRLLRKSKSRDPIHFRGSHLGNIAIEEAYLYPLAVAAATTDTEMAQHEIMETVLEKMTGHEMAQPSRVLLRDGTSFYGFPFGLEISNNVMTAKFLDQQSQMPRVVPLPDIINVQ